MPALRMSDVLEMPRPNGAPRFRCSACRRDFSPTSGTLFAFHKLEIRDYLAAVVIFCDEVKGKAARRAISMSSTRPLSWCDVKVA